MNNTTDAPLMDESWQIGWRHDCEKLAADASKGDGCSYTWYVVRLSGAVSHALRAMPKDRHAKALEIAREFGYATDEERQAEQDELQRDGYCMHGIELGCCPAGCGSGPDD